jgi:hypothetical protein
MRFMKNNKNTIGVHPHPQIPAAGHRESQIPASHRRLPPLENPKNSKIPQIKIKIIQIKY